MDTLYEVITNEERETVLDVLREERADHKRSGDLASFWNTARMYQSLTRLIIKKQIYVNDINDIQFVLASFVKVKERISINLEVWLRKDLSDEEIDHIAELLLEITNTITQEQKLCLFRSLPNCLAEKMVVNYQKYDFKIGLSKPVEGLFREPDSSERIISSNGNYIVKDLSEKHVDLLIESWTYGHPLDREWIERSIQGGYGLGLCEAITHEHIGHFIYSLTGVYGALYVNDKYRGKGLSKVLVSEMLRKSKIMEMDMLIEIEEGNTISKGLFTSMKYQVMTESRYLAFYKGEQSISPKDDL